MVLRSDSGFHRVKFNDCEQQASHTINKGIGSIYDESSEVRFYDGMVYLSVDESAPGSRGLSLAYRQGAPAPDDSSDLLLDIPISEWPDEHVEAAIDSIICS